jgi:hypothetical protein
VEEFVPRDFGGSRRLERPQFVVESLGSEHDDQASDAWQGAAGLPGSRPAPTARTSVFEGRDSETTEETPKGA